MNAIRKTGACGLALLMVVAVSACGPRGASEGRSGNDAYADSSFKEAAEAYQNGLSELRDSDRGPVRSKLFNNLGAARYQQQNYQGARSAFRQAVATARHDSALVRALYNTGNAAFRLDSTQAALGRYRATLLGAPHHQDAKFNYEFVKRNLPDSENSDQQQQEQESPDVDPSEYARKLKKQADELAERRNYRAAHRLMEQGLRVDRTVRAYQSFMQRLQDVSNIDQTPSDQPSNPPDGSSSTGKT